MVLVLHLCVLECNLKEQGALATISDRWRFKLLGVTILIRYKVDFRDNIFMEVKMNIEQ
jgi:hypothetical protein